MTAFWLPLREYEETVGAEVPDDYRKVLTGMLAEGIVGLLIEWFREPGAYNKEEIVQNVSDIIHATVPAAVRAGAKKS